ncbi:MAG: SPFH domain-containing protein [Janthinobacterium lividum]
MSFSLFGHQLATVIQWPNPVPGVLLYQFPSANGDEIKNASKLLVGPGQGVLLVYEGAVSDVLDAEGIYDLATDNQPFITTLSKLRTGFESEHKLRVYFYRRADNVNQNWGTATPVKYLDPVYKFPVQLGANGNFSFRVADARQFFTQVTGLADLYTTQQARTLLQGRIAQDLATQLAVASFSYQQLDAQLTPLATSLRTQLAAEFTPLGLELTDFRLSGTVFDQATQQRIGEIADVTAESQAAAAGGLSFADLEKLRALRDAARTSGGLAGAGMQLGVGAELGRLLASQPGSPAAAGPAASDPATQLQKLKQLLDEGVLTPAEYAAKRQPWLDKL